MRFFSRSRKAKRLLAVAFEPDGACVASVRRSPEGKPELKLASFFASKDPRSAELLEKIHKDVNGGLYRCSALLGGGEYQMLAVEAPAVPPEEMKVAIRWRLKDMLDFPVDQATIDVLNVPVDKALGRPNGLFAIAARNSVIETRQNLFLEAKLGLDTIDIPEMAQRNVSVLLEEENRGLAMLSFTGEGGLLTVTYKGELYLSRRMDVPVEQLLDQDYDRKHACFDRITLELQRSLDHFERQYSFINVAKLVLAPTGATGMEEYLSSNLYTRVETLDLARVIDLSAVPDLAAAPAQQRFFMAIGAALRKDEVSA